MGTGILLSCSLYGLAHNDKNKPLLSAGGLNTLSSISFNPHQRRGDPRRGDPGTQRGGDLSQVEKGRAGRKAS